MTFFLKIKWQTFIRLWNAMGFEINMVFFTTILILSISIANRAFSIGGFAAILFVLFYYRKIQFRPFQLLVAALVTCSVVLLLALFIKSDSSLGRVLIYKISWEIFLENFVSGVGAGKFKVKYGIFQAEYFKKNLFTEKEFLLADNVFYAFNDYWQFVIEYGIVGAFILVLAATITFKLIRRKIRKAPLDTALCLSVGIILVMLTAAVFTHVFDKKIFQLGLAINILYIITCNSKAYKYLSCKSIIPVITIITFIIITAYRWFSNIPNYVQFAQAKDLWAAGYRQEAKKKSQLIRPYLKNDVEFLMFYAESFIAPDEMPEKIKAYKYLISKVTDYRLYVEQGKNYENLKLFKEAEQCYITAIYMVPNRFRTRGLLIDLYIKNGRKTQAELLAAATLRMPVKIPSAEVESIKMDIESKIKKKFYN